MLTLLSVFNSIKSGVFAMSSSVVSAASEVASRTTDMSSSSTVLPTQSKSQSKSADKVSNQGSHDRDILRRLAEVNFIYGEVMSSLLFMSHSSS